MDLSCARKACHADSQHCRLGKNHRTHTSNYTSRTRSQEQEPVPSDSLPAPSNPLRQHVEDLKMRLQLAEATLDKGNRPGEDQGIKLVLDAIHGVRNPIAAPHDEDMAFADIEASFRALSIHNKTGFYGNGSTAALLKGAVDVAKDSRKLVPRDDPLCHAIPAPIQTWKGHGSIPMSAYSFPETDLLSALVSSYFDRVNVFLPVLHRPVFERDLCQHFHKSHSGFAKTVLLVCAVGARYSTDPRVSTSGTDTAGWKWFNQVDPCGHLLHIYPTAYDIQAYCLSALFLDATANPRMAWNVVGCGMRAAQDLGLHRSTLGPTAVNLVHEVQRRALWVLLLLDTQIGTALGRGSTLESAEVDLYMPAVCDDVFWGSPDDPPHMRFRQPAGKPSTVAFFNCMIDLNRILALSCDILYSSNRKRLEMGLDNTSGWQKLAVSELDGALNAWFETIPKHLRWDADILVPDETFFDQSAALQCAYYHARIIIHRPFIPSMVSGQDPTNWSSLAICNTAARACSHVAEIHHRRRPDNPLWFSKTPLFTAGIVLLMNIWAESGNLRARSRDLRDVQQIITVLSSQRQQWPSVGPLLETLQQLVAVEYPPSTLRESRTAAEVPSRPARPSEVNEVNEANPLPETHHIPTASALTLPMYDSQLETAPPSDYLDGYLAQDAGFAEDNGPASSTDPANSVWVRVPDGFEVGAWETYLSSGGQGF
ncbi:fungal-specific transcription factor domain-containing protein [Mycena rosella]|uniref:Fungal-specific transcription factor domain-containing protein n=1 Tax=Mycena rosella TaxID=1033263 RepID=A0AAD7G445_MYCRO|nr:fungal-specific transcription factor domain-containing protein [Mycena rosella]